MKKIKYTSNVSLYGCSYSVAQELLNQYNGNDYSAYKTIDIISKNCIRCEELDLIAKEYATKVETIVEKFKRNPPDWIDQTQSIEAIENDYFEESLQDEYFVSAEYDASVLLPMNKRKLIFSWDTIRKYGWDGLSLIESNKSRSDKVQIIRQGEPYRETAEKFEKLGLATRGINISYSKIFEKFSVEQLKSILTGIDFPKSIKKQDLINLLSSQKDVDARLIKLCAIDDLFLFTKSFPEITDDSLNDGLIYYRYCSQVDRYLINSIVSTSKPLQLNWIDKINSNVPSLN